MKPNLAVTVVGPWEEPSVFGLPFRLVTTGGLEGAYLEYKPDKTWDSCRRMWPTDAEYYRQAFHVLARLAERLEDESLGG